MTICKTLDFYRMRHPGPKIVRPPTRVELQIENQNLRATQLEKERARAATRAAREEVEGLRVFIAKLEAEGGAQSLFSFQAAIINCINMIV